VAGEQAPASAIGPMPEALRDPTYTQRTVEEEERRLTRERRRRAKEAFRFAAWQRAAEQQRRLSSLLRMARRALNSAVSARVIAPGEYRQRARALRAWERNGYNRVEHVRPWRAFI